MAIDNEESFAPADPGELQRLRNLEMQVVKMFAHEFDDGDDKCAEDLLDMVKERWGSKNIVKREKGGRV